MTISVLFGKRKAGKIGELQLDATIQEVHEYRNEISEYPIEDGSILSDNIRLMPDTLLMTGFVTNSPVTPGQDNKAEVVTLDNGKVEVKNFKREGQNNNVEFAQDVLLRISGRRIQGTDVEPELVTVVTGLRVYDSMAIENLSIPRDASTGLALRFECTLKKVQRVKTETVAIPNPKLADTNRTQSTVSSGQNTAAQTKKDQTAKAKASSTAFKLATKIGIL
jgi:hypothetical protein